MADTSNVSLYATGVLGLCPRCNEGKIFSGPLELVEACPHCQLDLKSHDNGDGPAFFVITIVGFMVTALAAYVEFQYMPPFWLHAVLWIPFILIASIGLLRIFKGMLLASQYKHQLMGHDDSS